MIIKRTVIGIASASKGNFRPQRLAVHPKKIFPKNPPTHISDTIHDTSSSVISPLSNGVSSLDCNTLLAADAHPQVKPYERVIKFATNRNAFYSITLRLYWRFKVDDETI